MIYLLIAVSLDLKSREIYIYKDILEALSSEVSSRSTLKKPMLAMRQKSNCKS